MIRVALADDQALVRRGLAVLLGAEPDLEVVGEAGDGAQAVALVEHERPDVVVMDIRMPGIDGLEATRRISAQPQLAGTRVLMLTTYGLDDYVIEALRSGASGFLLKDALPTDLLAAVRVVADGESLLDPKVTRRLIAEFLRRQPARPPDSCPDEALNDLTDREREVLVAVAHGLSNTEIARQLTISYATAKTHVSHLLTKLGARDRAQLVMKAYECGLVRAGEE